MSFRRTYLLSLIAAALFLLLTGLVAFATDGIFFEICMVFHFIPLGFAMLDNTVLVVLYYVVAVLVLAVIFNFFLKRWRRNKQ